MSELTTHFLLRGIAGSHAHGLATENSDEDLHGVFGYDTEEFYGLDTPADSLVGHEPQDYSYHEIRKFLGLALKSNPTVLELLWLDKYLEKDDYGNWLIEIRGEFLSSEAVKNSYLGYAHSQFMKIFRRDGEKPNLKNVRHLFRLLEAGYDLYTTGDMSITVKDRDWYFWIQDQDFETWKTLYHDKRAAFDEAVSPLPERPNRAIADSFLRTYRTRH